MQKEELYRKVIKKFGVNKQITKTIEELSELQKALCKFQLYNSPDELVKLMENIGEEIADVEIMIEQLKIILKGIDETLLPMIGNFKNDKLQRMEKSLEAKECILPV